MKKYPSDISRKAFETKVQPILEKARKKTKPATIDVYEVFNGVLYVLKSGCHGRMLPDSFPKWQTCYAYWRKWSAKRKDEPSLLEKALKKCGRSHSTLPWVGRGNYIPDIDAQSVKNTDTAEEKGFDGGKLVSGIKRHIGVDTNGLPHMIHVTTADVTDRAGALQAFALYKDNLTKVQNVLADGGYTGEPFASGTYDTLGATVEIAKRNNLHKFAVIPKRWVVEHSFAWLEKCRRLWKSCERKLNTSLQMAVLAFLALLIKRE